VLDREQLMPDREWQRARRLLRAWIGCQRTTSGSQSAGVTQFPRSA
jgi:hypothetical protein